MPEPTVPVSYRSEISAIITRAGFCATRLNSCVQMFADSVTVCSAIDLPERLAAFAEDLSAYEQEYAILRARMLAVSETEGPVEYPTVESQHRRTMFTLRTCATCRYMSSILVAANENETPVGVVCCNLGNLAETTAGQNVIDMAVYKRHYEIDRPTSTCCNLWQATV